MKMFISSLLLIAMSSCISRIRWQLKKEKG